MEVIKFLPKKIPAFQRNPMQNLPDEMRDEKGSTLKITGLKIILKLQIKFSIMIK